MAKSSRLDVTDWCGLAVVAILGIGSWLFRFKTIQPLWTVGACAAVTRPFFCTPRQAVLWLQYHQAFGWTALLFGIAAFALGRRGLGALAIGLGIAATVNYNATTGVVGAALGLYAWIGAKTGRYRQT